MRPVLRWHGGKFRIASWVVSHFPEHRVYVEPFGGAGSVLMRKPRSYCEVYNDIDDQLYHLFHVIRERTDELVHVLTYTPYSRRDFELSHITHPDPLENARRLLVRSFMGFGSDSASNPARSTGFRSKSNKSNSAPPTGWVNYIAYIHNFAERFRGVVIENRDALELIPEFDDKTALFYVDPPYVYETRKRVGAYRHEFDKHAELIEVLKACRGTVILSGYDSPAYEKWLSGWKRVQKEALADGALKRTEFLWIKS